MSSRSKKSERAKRVVWFTLLFTALVAPVFLLLLDKALPDGLFLGGEVPKEIRLSLKNTSKWVLEAKNRLLQPAEIALPQHSRPAVKEKPAHDVDFSNKGDGNEIDNAQETNTGQTTGFSNEGNNNKIKNVQRSK